jgi:beta-lactamase regulating signal transducer with metallopeptidase domain
MGILENIISQEIAQRIGWMLVHFVWQAAAVALVLAIALKVLRKSSANLRYIIACSALGLMVLLPLMTMRLVSVPYPEPAGIEPVAVGSAVEEVKEIATVETPVMETPARLERVAVSPRVSLKERAVSAVEPALPYMVLGWLVGVFGLSVWHLGGWTQLQRLRRQMVKPIDESLRSKLKELAELLGVKQAVEIAESALVGVPTVVGWLKPMILLPASALTGLAGEQLDAILAHELAHIKRCDYLVNMLQTVVEILGFFHPAVWWVSVKIRAERENCCDDLAVSISGDKVCYARALTSMAEIRGRVPELAVAATGGSLFGRISRLLGKESADKTKAGWAPSVIAILLVMAIVIPAGFAISSKTDEGQNTEDRIQETGEKKFVEALANGVTVKLVGVCDYPDDKMRCWRPDGSELKDQMYVERERDYKKGKYGFIIKVDGPEDISFAWNKIKGSKGWWGSCKVLDENGNPLEGFEAAIIKGYDGRGTTDIRVGIATGHWNTVAKHDGKSMSLRKGVAFASAYESNDAVRIIVTDSLGNEVVQRVVAIDKSGNVHPCKGSAGSVSNQNLRQTTANFQNIRIHQIREFQFQIRPYKWVEFKNVSLKPNFKTDVRVEVEGIEEIPTQQLKQLVEDFFKHNYRDITARKTIEWGEPTVDTNGNMSIRYKYEATIWDKDKIITDQLFVFDKNGELVSFNKISPFPVGSKQWLQERVEEFFKSNYRDVTARKTVEWGEPISVPNNNYSIRYKYEATIWGKDKIVQNKIFTFDANGKFVSANDVEQTIEQNSIKNSNIQTAHPQPIAYWNFDGDADDKIGGNNGDVYGATLAQGISGQAYHFDGKSDYIQTPLNIDQSGDENVTISAWVYPTNPSTGVDQIVSSDNGGHDWSLARWGKRWAVFTGDGRWDPGFEVDTNKWQHVAVVFKPGEDVIFYKNAVSNSKGLPPGTDASDNNITIGNNPGWWNGHFKGKIDEVTIYERALSADEIHNIYHALADSIVAKSAKKPAGQVETKKIVEDAVLVISTCAENDPKVQKALESLKGLDEQAAVKEVAKFLDSDKNTVRRSAMYILWKGNFKSIEPAAASLEKLCSHKEEYTRGMAALALGAGKVDLSFDTLCKMTLEDSSAYARRCAAYALGLIGKADAKPVLEKALKDSDFNVRNNAEAALTMISQAEKTQESGARSQKADLQVIEDKKLNLSIAIPADWNCYKNPAPGRYKFSWQLLPAKLKAWAMFIGSEGVSQADTTVRQIAIGDVAVLKSHFDKYAVRENSWAEYSICETPAVSYVADYADEGKAMVEYRSYILGKSMVYWFVFRIEKDKFDSNKELFDSIVKSFKLNRNTDEEVDFAKSAAWLRVAELQKRVESAKKLSGLCKALLIYANDHEEKYPDNLEEIKPYDTDGVLAWSLENVEYLGKGKNIIISPQAVIAYDKTLLEKGKGTNVLYNDCHVSFEKPESLEKLGIKAENSVGQIEYFERQLEDPVTVHIDKSPDGDKLTIQYAVMAVCKVANVPYNWDKSAELADPQRREYIEPVNIKNNIASQAIADMVGPVGLLYGVDANGVYLYKPEKAAKTQSVLEILDIEVEPVAQGKNTLYATVKNTSDTEQLFAIHIYTRSVDYGPKGVGWGTRFFEKLKSNETKRTRFVYKIQGPVTENTYIRVKFYNPTTEKEYNYDKPFAVRVYKSSDLQKREPTRELEPVSSKQFEEISKTLKMLQNHIRNKEYKKVWDLFTEDHKKAEYQSRGFEAFKRQMEPTHPLHSAFHWDKKQFLKLKPVHLDINARNNSVTLLATYKKETWKISFAREDDEWKIDWIGGYRPAILDIQEKDAK